LPAPWRTLCALAVLVSMSGCRPDEPQRLAIRIAGVPARVEIAADPQSRGQGLMERAELGPDEGMLLVFPRERPIRLWMLNTHIPLDAGFFDGQGVLVGKAAMRPDGGKEIHSSPRPARYALEMNLGWFERHGIAPGSRLELPYPIQGQ